MQHGPSSQSSADSRVRLVEGSRCICGAALDTMNIMNIDDALPPNDGGHLSSIVPAISDGMRCQADAMNNNYRNGLTMRNSYSEARVCNDHELSEAPSPPAVAACTHAKPAALGLSISTAAVPALRHSLAMYIALGP